MAGRLRAVLGAGFLAVFAPALLAPGAGAQIIGPQDPDDPKVDSPWQAGTCKDDGPPECSIATPEKFFEQAAGHPPVGFTQFIVNTEPGPLGPVPTGNIRTVRVDIPPGLTVNPQSTPQCDLAPEESPAECEAKEPEAKVGTSIVRATNPTTGFTLTLDPADVFNLVPEPGEPARFGFSVLGNDVFLETDIAWEDDYHEYFTIHAHALELPVPGLEVARIAENRLVFDGTAGAGNGTFITTPTTCFGPAAPESPFEHIYSTWLRADSFEEPDPNFPHGSAFVESKIPYLPPEVETFPKECDSIPYEPELSADPATALTDSPSGAAVTVELPEIKDPDKEGLQATSHTRSATATLPEGLGLNPSAASGLVACADAQFGKGTRNPVACPPASKVGDVTVETPPLPAGSLTGDVFIGQQLSRDPASGDAYRIFVTAESALHDISARLLGKVRADPQTGQLTTSFDDAALGKVPISGLPQVPFTAFRLDFNDGPKAPLTSPPTCGPHTASTTMTPWSGNSPETVEDEFTLSSAPGGGECPESLAERRFSPGFGAALADARAGAYSPLTISITRSDGEQELKGTIVDLPPGLSARLAGVAYCPEAALAEAAASSGAAEAASPRCPDSSLVGGATVLAGSGPDPLRITGKAFLTGPYNGAPLSLAIVTPATAGPFDLGSVVVRVALFVDRQTARVHAVSDVIPHVFGGALLDLHSVVISLDHPRFSLNPTNCSPMSLSSALRGGGGNPQDPAAFSSFPAASFFQVHECDALGFKPKLFMRLFGATRRAKNPKLRAVVVAREGDANIGRAAVTLPKALILDQSSIANVCTRVQYAANACPINSIYGFARAFTPLLNDPLEGPVILRSSDNPLPDLVASLNGQVGIDLVGRTDSVKGRIRNTFDVLPDVPVTKFVLTVRGGKSGLLTNTRRLCGKRAPKKLRAFANFAGQNGKKAKQRPKLRRPCRKGKRG